VVNILIIYPISIERLRLKERERERKKERKKEKLSKKLLVLAYDLLSPVLLIEPIIFLHFRSHLMNSQCQKNNNPLF